MYKIIIVDDEEIMREGLINLVDWKALGFEIVAQFEDGDEALEYLKINRVDVLLTDIKMTFVSGLDLARYINDHKLSTKVVLISGYEDFEFARQAVSYNVVQYMLKPISLRDIQSVFSKIRLEMDTEKESMKRQDDKQKKYIELLAATRAQFFMDLVLGALRNPDELKKRLQLLDVDIDPENRPCCLWVASIYKYEDFLDKHWDYGSDAFYKAIGNMFCVDKDSLEFQFINGREGRFKILIIGSPGLSQNVFTQFIEDHINNAGVNTKKMLGIELFEHCKYIFENLCDLAINMDISKKSWSQTENGSSVELNVEVQEHLLDQQKLLMTHIRDGNRESAFSLMDLILEEIRPLRMEHIQSFLDIFFNTLFRQLQKNEIYISEDIKAEWTDLNKLDLNTFEEIKQYLLMRLDTIMHKAKDGEKQSDHTITSHIKEYIRENYSKDITLENVADHVFLSPVYVSRLFKEKTGENFSDYLIRIRIEQALVLLKEPRLKVYEVGHLIGYKSTKHFYKIFKQYHGCTPTEYRKNLYVRGERR